MDESMVEDRSSSPERNASQRAPSQRCTRIHSDDRASALLAPHSSKARRCRQRDPPTRRWLDQRAVVSRGRRRHAAFPIGATQAACCMDDALDDIAGQFQNAVWPPAGRAGAAQRGSVVLAASGCGGDATPIAPSCICRRASATRATRASPSARRAAARGLALDVTPVPAALMRDGPHRLCWRDTRRSEAEESCSVPFRPPI